MELQAQLHEDIEQIVRESKATYNLTDPDSRVMRKSKHGAYNQALTHRPASIRISYSNFRRSPRMQSPPHIQKARFWSVFSSLLATLTLIACQPELGRGESSKDHSSSSELTVFAATSTTNAMQELAALYETVAGVRITASFAASSTLARQIEAGAPADIFLSANPKWMDYLESGGHLIDGSRRDLLGNRIALIAPADSSLDSLEINAEFDLLNLLGADGRLAMGDPSHVPAGLYGKQALESLGLWEAVATRLAPMADVRAAMTPVERGETPLGIVYATDAAISKRVKVVATFPKNTHTPIIYPAALVQGADAEQAQALLEFLKDPSARAVFQKYGFVLVD